MFSCSRGLFASVAMRSKVTRIFSKVIRFQMDFSWILRLCVSVEENSRIYLKIRTPFLTISELLIVLRARSFHANFLGIITLAGLVITVFG